MSELQTPIQVDFRSYRCFRQTSDSSLTLQTNGVVALTGINNSGKSTALRFFYELKLVLNHLTASSEKWESKSEGVFTTKWKFQWQQVYGLSDTLEMFPSRDQSRPIEFRLATGNVEVLVQLTIEPGSPIRDQLVMNTTIKLNSDLHGQGLDPSEIVREELVNPLSRILYIGPFRNLVNDAGGGGTYYDLRNGALFVPQWAELKNGQNTVDAQSAVKVQEVIRQLLNFQSFQIDASADRKSLHVTVNNDRFNLSELGAGIAQLIICLINVAVKNPTWILIDEPELHLHPTMQAKFVEALGLFAEYGVVIATHSIGLARTIADEVYVVSQPRPNVSTIKHLKDVKNYAQLLGELSFSQYEAVGFSKILLVEGVTDVKTFHQLLPLFNARKVLVVPLGGNAMINPDRQMELAEFQRFAVDVYVLIDSEKVRPDHLIPHRVEFVKLCEGLFGEGHAMQTERRATENYLPQLAIRKAMRSEKYDALQPHQSFADLDYGWSKNDNWKIAAETNRADWANTDVGNFLAKLADA